MLLTNITERVEAMESELRKKNLLFSLDADTQSTDRQIEQKKPEEEGLP